MNMKVSNATVTCQHGTTIQFDNDEMLVVIEKDDCYCKPSEFKAALAKTSKPVVVRPTKAESILAENIIEDFRKSIPKSPKGESTTMTPDELKEKCILWFNTEKQAVSELTYEQTTERCHEFEQAILELQTKVRAGRSHQYELLEAMDEDKRQEYLRYKPVPPSIKEKLEKDALTPEQKKAAKLEKEIVSNMQSLNLDRDMAIAFLKKMKPNLFN